MRGLILSILAFTVVTAAVNVSTAEAPEGFHEITYQYAKDVEVPYLDFDLKHLAIIENQRQAHAEAVRAAKAAEVEEVPTEEKTAVNEPVYLGVWTCTAYCPGACCCGEYASGYTASGTLATEGRTIACNSLPMGSKVLIDGNTYIVEDTGWTPYGDEWIDIFFYSHDAALAFGVQEKEVYLLAN